MDLAIVLKRINFVERYQAICNQYNDFDNRLRGNNIVIYTEIIEKLGYKAKYHKKECFYRIVSMHNNIEFGLQLTLKGGIIEPMLDVKRDNVYLSPDGRFDFIPQRMNVKFDRERNTLPTYTSLEELEEILKGLFSIYKDIKKELANM